MIPGLHPVLRLAVCLAGAVVIALVLASVAFLVWPLPASLLDRTPMATVRFTDRGGSLLRELHSREDGRSIGLPANQPIPPLIRAAFVAAEDRRFGHHLGVDPLATVRAAWQDLRARRIVSGGSTIAQQLARQLVPRRRTLAGKIQEALWALRLTLHLPQETLLRAYLDRVALGNGQLGVESAAETYFGRPAASLSLGQAALLAGIAGAPARWEPYRHPGVAQARMREVLRRMSRLGILKAAEAQAAAEAPLDLVAPARAFGAPHFVAQLELRLAALGLDRAVEIETTLDPGLQGDIEAIVREQLSGDGRIDQAAVLVLDNHSGEVLAYVGSSDFFDEGHQGQNDGARALRQPGSALKPFAYALALSEGYTAATLLSDVEVRLSTPAGEYVPRNYDRRVHGPVRLRAALANSYNVPAVRLADALGPERVLGVLHRAGFDSLSEPVEYYGAGIILGNGNVTLRELARAYRGLARGGVLEPLREIRHARDVDGHELPVAREVEPRRFLPEDAAALVTDVISDEAARAPAFGLHNALRLAFPVAAKTGTSHAFVDNWTIGFTRERTVAVWTGNFDGRPMQGVSGITGAGPIFARTMSRAMRDIAPRPLVDRSRFERVQICPLSGRLAGPNCPSALDEVFRRGTAPHTTCPMHRWHGGPVLDVGSEYYGWARAEGIAAGPWPADPQAEGAAASTDGGVAQLLLPRSGDEYLMEAGFPTGSQTIPVRARPPAGIMRLELRSDDGVVQSLGPPFEGRIQARPGRHRVELWLPGARQPAAVAEFLVRGDGP